MNERKTEFQYLTLNSETEILPFDCEESELNGFLFDDAKNYLQERLAKTYLIKGDKRTVAYWALLNDSLSVKDFGDDINEKSLKRFGALRSGGFSALMFN